MNKIRLGTRGSPLALKQAEEVSALLLRFHPGLQVETVKIKTTGDRISEWTAPPEETPVGAFVREIESALLAGEIDLAVHSLKDLPTALPAALELGAVPPRKNPAEALLSRAGLPLASLPRGARVGTGSLRRKVQLLASRPDCAVLPLRGNVGTRLRKLKSGDYDAVVAARAGLERLGLLSEITEELAPDDFLPAVGQGAIGIEIRKDAHPLRELVLPLDHPDTHSRIRAERSFLHRLGVGCRAPAAALARLEGEILVLRGMFSDPEGLSLRRGEKSGPREKADELGIALAEELLRPISR